MIAIAARLFAVSLAVTLAALFIVAFFAPPAQAQSFAALAASCDAPACDERAITR